MRDPEAFEALYAAHSRYIAGVVHRIIGRADGGAARGCDALERIPEDLRIPWVLHRVEQLSLPETAEACEISLATVKRRIAEAEERIQRRLEMPG